MQYNLNAVKTNQSFFVAQDTFWPSPTSTRTLALTSIVYTRHALHMYIIGIHSQHVHIDNCVCTMINLPQPQTPWAAI